MAPTHSYKGPFLFVNKNPANLKDRSTDEAFAIGSHVSGPYTKWHKSARVRTLLPSEPTLRTEARQETILEKEELKKCIEISSTQSTPLASHDVRRHIPHRKVATASPHRSFQTPLRRTRSNPASLVQHGNSDPFSAAPVEITPLNHFLLTTWQGIFWQTVLPSELLQMVPMPTIICNEGIDFISSAEKMHFQLAWTLSLQLSAMPDSQAKKTLEVEALVHKAKGMNKIQKTLPTLPKTTAIRAIWHLMGAEFYSGNSTAALTHHRALVALVKSAGGLASLPWDLMKLVAVADMTLSQFANRRSLFDVVRSPVS